MVCKNLMQPFCMFTFEQRGERMIWMRDISWNIFAATGNIESYLLYKEHERIVNSSKDQQQEQEETLTDAVGSNING